MEKQKTTQLRWYVAYTYPQAEKRVDQKVKEMGFESFLPTQKVVRQWSDRKKTFDVPLFPNYIFIRTTPHNRFAVLSIKELVRFISFSGQPVAVPDEDIASLKKIASGEITTSNEVFGGTIGERVRITHGQFAGIEGILTKNNGHQKLVIQIEAMKQAVSIEIESGYVVAA